jgi:hypothetical protein
MSQPVDPAVADAAVQAQLAGQAQAVTGDPAAAGVYGDPAGAAQPPQPLDLSSAHASVVDAAELLARLQRLEEDARAREEAANPPPAPPDNTLRADGNAPAWLAELVGKIEARLAALEGKTES